MSEFDLPALLAAIEASSPARALRASFVAYPVVNAVHILGAGALVTLVWLMHAAARRRLGAQLGTERAFRILAVCALAVMALSGLALFSVKPAEYFLNAAFRIKMLLITAALLNVAAHHALHRLSPRLGMATVLFSALLWPGVLIAGRWIAFV